MPLDLSDVIGSAEACELLNVDRSTLTRWVAKGLLHTAEQMPGPSGAFLFDRTEITALAARRARDGGRQLRIRARRAS